jgi:hypothetical protein
LASSAGCMDRVPQARAFLAHDLERSRVEISALFQGEKGRAPQGGKEYETGLIYIWFLSQPPN